MLNSSSGIDDARYMGSELVICVTGVSGFIGTHLLPMLKRSGARLRVLRRDGQQNQAEGVETYIGDLFNQQSLDSFLLGAHTVINLAQPSGSLSDARFAEGMTNLGRAAWQAGIQRFLHVSTAMVIGVPPADIVDEATIGRPITVYERQKFSAERILQEELAGRVDLGILRPTAVFGSGGQNLLKLARTIADSAGYHRSLLRFIHGRRRMHLVSVRDVAEAIIFLAFLPRSLSGNVFLISADDEPDNYYQAVDAIIGDVMDKRLPKTSAYLPNAILRMVLRLAGRSQANPKLIYDAGKLSSWGFQRESNFECELKQFVENYLQEKGSS